VECFSSQFTITRLWLSAIGQALPLVTEALIYTPHIAWVRGKFSNCQKKKIVEKERCSYFGNSQRLPMSKASGKVSVDVSSPSTALINSTNFKRPESLDDL
jgi:hypothetical protein